MLLSAIHMVPVFHTHGVHIVSICVLVPSYICTVTFVRYDTCYNDIAGSTVWHYNTHSPFRWSHHWISLYDTRHNSLCLVTTANFNNSIETSTLSQTILEIIQNNLDFKGCRYTRTDPTTTTQTREVFGLSSPRKDDLLVSSAQNWT